VRFVAGKPLRVVLCVSSATAPKPRPAVPGFQQQKPLQQRQCHPQHQHSLTPKCVHSSSANIAASAAKRKCVTIQCKSVTIVPCRVRANMRGDVVLMIVVCKVHRRVQQRHCRVLQQRQQKNLCSSSILICIALSSSCVVGNSLHPVDIVSNKDCFTHILLAGAELQAVPQHRVFDHKQVL